MLELQDSKCKHKNAIGGTCSRTATELAIGVHSLQVLVRNPTSSPSAALGLLFGAGIQLLFL